MPDPRMDNLRELPPEMLFAMRKLDGLFGAFDRAAPAEPIPERFTHPLDETVSETVEKIEAAALSLLMLRDGINGALLRGEDPEDIMRQLPPSVARARDELDGLLKEIG